MSHCLPDSAWADGNLAELAEQLGKMVEYPNQSQPNPGPCADGAVLVGGANLAWRHIILLVDELQHGDRGDELGEGEEQLVEALVVEVVIVVIHVRPPVKINVS